MALALNIPIYLTLLRIALIPLLTIVFYLPWENANVACMLIFCWLVLRIGSMVI